MVKSRIERLRAFLAKHEIDGLLITHPINRRYISGFTGTAGLVVVTEKDALLLTDFRYVEQAEQQAAHFTIVRHHHDVAKQLAEELSQRGITRLGFEQDHLSYGLYSAWQGILDQVSCQLVPVSGLVEELRLVKDDAELKLIKKAVQIADEAFAHILTVIQPGMTELEVATELEMKMRQLGASSSSFDIIVASGPRSALPHGVASDKTLKRGELVTLDFGAIYQGYVSDLTRTIALGEPDPQLRKIYEICLDAQVKGVSSIKAGLTGQEADALCRDLITAHGFGEHFGHSTGHGIGLEVHEGPTLSTRSNTVLKAGMVVTVEPGIYLPGLGGVRIEDDVLIGEGGSEILTSSPKELLIIE